MELLLPVAIIIVLSITALSEYFGRSCGELKESMVECANS